MFKNCFTAQTADVLPGITARNKAVLDYEKYIHQTFYPFIIHPYSLFRIYWEILVILTYPIRLLLFFIIWTFFNHHLTFVWYLIVLIKIITIIDVILMFFTGYVEPKTEIVVLDPKLIARRYILRGFVLELATCFPIEYLDFFFKDHCSKLMAENCVTMCEIMVCISILGLIFGMVRLIRYMKNTAKVFMWNPFLVPLITILYYYFVLDLFHFSVMRLEKYSSEEEKETSVKNEFYHTLKLLLQFLFDILFLNLRFAESSIFIQILLLVFNFFVNLFFFAYSIKFIMGKLKEGEKISFLESRVRSFVKKRNLTYPLKQKVLLYFQILLHDSQKNNEIFNYIPNTFKADIFFYLCLPLLKSFYAFEDLPTYVLRRLAEALKYQLYLPNEVVSSQDDPLFCMFFIQRGTLALYSARQVEMYHFEAGSSINGRYFISGKRPVSHSIISTEVAEVYSLEYKKYKDIMLAYPELQKKMIDKFYNTVTESQDLIDTVFDSYS